MINTYLAHKALFRCIATAAMLIAVCGCSRSRDWKFADLFDLKKDMPWHHDGPENDVPSRVVGTWTDTVLTQAGKKPQRGFGGRLLFYNNESNDPIQVDGQLVVYAFDESNREPTDNRPTRRYVFPADQVPLHESVSELGPSYSFWLPWDEVGGPQTEVSLICRFEPKGGPLVMSEQTKHKLPGELVAQAGPPKLPEGVPFKPGNQQALYSAGNQAGANPVQEASYERPVSSGSGASAAPSAERRMQTTSISLPESFRIQGSSAAVPAGPAMPTRVPSVSRANATGGAPSTGFPLRPVGGVGTIPSTQDMPTPGFAPPVYATPIYATPTNGYPGAAVAPPTMPTQLQPISPAGSSGLAPIGQQTFAPQALPQFPQQQAAGPTVPNGLQTTVQMLTPGETARRQWGQPSLGSTPAGLPAPIRPAFQ